MLRSMTGYGRGEAISHDRRFKVEIKSVNHRYGDITVKLPRFLNPLEDRVRKRLAKDIQRGKIDVYIHFESYTAKDVSVRINEAFTDAYVQALRALTDRYGLTEPVSLSLLAAQPDIFDIERNTAADNAETQSELWETLSEALEKALTLFNHMREAEGEALYQDLRAKRERVGVLLGQVKERAPAVSAEYAQRLRERVTEALAEYPVDEGRLLTEIAIFTDRAAIDEELTRLDSHLAQMGDILNEQNQVGRKLDFLVQEFNREINTIGSKSNDTHITRLVVDLKSELEKIREQVQNIE